MCYAGWGEAREASCPTSKQGRENMAHFTHDFKLKFDDVTILKGDCEFNEDGIGSYVLSQQPDDGLTVTQSAQFNNLINSITHLLEAYKATFGSEITMLRFKKKTS